MKQRGILSIFVFILIVLGGAFFLGMFSYFIKGSSVEKFDWGMRDKVGIVTVDGGIFSADRTVEELDNFRKDTDIKSVVLRIESPGGSVAASQEIYEAIKLLAQKKPVIASMGSVAASGGYYIACAAKKIFANAGTVTGSIGVRMEHVMVGDLLKWAKLKHETLKSGQFKDMGSVDRDLTQEERDIIQEMLDDIHVQFKEIVAASRGLDIKKVNELADGRVYTGRQALALGLVDELGGFSEAIKWAAKEGGITGEPKLVKPKKKMKFVERIFDTASSLLSGTNAGFLDHQQPVLLME